MTSSEAAAVAQTLAGLTDPVGMSCDALLSAVSVLGELQSVLDAVKLRVVGELVARSSLAGAENPVTRSGQTQPAGVLEERWGIGRATARQYCRVGEAVVARRSLTGEELPPRLPVLAVAVGGADARLSVEQAGVIVRELTTAAPGCAPDELAVGERILVEHAPALTVTELRVLAGQVRDRLDEDGVEPREALQRRRRSLTITTTSEGMTHLDWYLDPESAGYVVSAIDAHVGAQLRSVRFQEDPDHASSEETRTMAQLRADAATEVFRHRATCTRPDTAGNPPVTVVVRIDWDALRSGVGVGGIDGIPAPISAGTVRRMAADARLIPAVLAGGSHVLDFGRSRRLFTTAQRRALAERDGGCAWPGCPHPPSYTEAHHLHWWNAHRGDTDLNNGILLCTTHHHRIHDDGWEIHVLEHVPYFIPPSRIDPLRRARAGGRIRLPDQARAA